MTGSDDDRPDMSSIGEDIDIDLAYHSLVTSSQDEYEDQILLRRGSSILRDFSLFSSFIFLCIRFFVEENSEIVPPACSLEQRSLAD